MEIIADDSKPEAFVAMAIDEHIPTAQPSVENDKEKILDQAVALKDTEMQVKDPKSNRNRDRHRERSRDRYDKAYSDKNRYRDHRERRHRKHYDSYSDSESYDDSKREYRKDRDRSRRRRRRTRDHRRHSDSEEYRKTSSERISRNKRSNDPKGEQKITDPKAQAVKIKGRGARHGQGLRSWSNNFLETKKPKEAVQETNVIRTNEDWISSQLKEIDSDLKKFKKSSPKWPHDKYETINRESDSECLENVERMSPPTMDKA